MASVLEILEQVERFLAKQVSLEDFEAWSAEYAWNIHQRADEETQNLARMVQAILNAFEDDQDETGLRLELAEAVRPFAFAKNRVGDPSPFVAESNADLAFNTATAAS
jgi:signal transduction histidine kinase